MIAAALLTAPAQAQVTGELWRKLGEDTESITSKVSYVKGVIDGLAVGLGGDTYSSEYPLHTDVKTLVDGVDEFYADPANRAIPVVWALRVLNLKLTGKSEEQINRETRYRRCASAEVMRSQDQTVDTLSRRVMSCAREE
jgi:hypothetical protein